jgi:nitrate reductase gamma subunit
MLPTKVTQYMPHVGLLLLLLGFVFGMIATNELPAVSDMSKKAASILTADSAKYSTLSTTLLLSGGFMLVAGSFH